MLQERNHSLPSFGGGIGALAAHGSGHWDSSNSSDPGDAVGPGSCLDGARLKPRFASGP